jgi:hypothetical protein
MKCVVRRGAMVVEILDVGFRADDELAQLIVVTELPATGETLRRGRKFVAEDVPGRSKRVADVGGR